MSRHRLAALVVLGVMLGAAGPAATAELEPCSLLTLVEVGAVLRGPATQDRPHTVRRNNVAVGGDCSYRSPLNRSIVITLHVDGYPGAHQRAAFEKGRQRPHITGISGLGDLAYAEAPPSGPVRVTFLKGDILVWVMAQGLGVAEARELARLAAARLPAPSPTPPAAAPRPPAAASNPQAALPGPPVTIAPSTSASRSSAPMMGATGPALAADVVDPALVGTWKLGWPRADFFWAIRPDGVYRMHGPGAPRQLGRMEAKQGRFSMRSPVWTDAGPYRLSSADTLVITGQLGPGTWKRVWTPARKDSPKPPGSGSCVLLTEDEVAQVLRAPVSGGPDPKSPDGCVYQSQLGQFDRVHIGRPGLTSPPSWLRNMATPRPNLVAIPGVADGAYTEYQTDHAVVRMLKGASEFQIRVSLVPPASPDDQPYLVELARAAGRRLADYSPPAPTDAQLKRQEAEEKARAEGWKGRLPAGQSIPPQKGPKPFKGW